MGIRTVLAVTSVLTTSAQATAGTQRTLLATLNSKVAPLLM